MRVALFKGSRVKKSLICSFISDSKIWLFQVIWLWLWLPLLWSLHPTLFQEGFCLLPFLQVSPYKSSSNEVYPHLAVMVCWYLLTSATSIGLPWWLSGKEPARQCRRHRFNSWVRKIPWTGKWQPTPVFLPGKIHGQRSLTGYYLWSHKRVRHNLVTKQQQ